MFERVYDYVAFENLTLCSVTLTGEFITLSFLNLWVGLRAQKICGFFLLLSDLLPSQKVITLLLAMHY